MERLVHKACAGIGREQQAHAVTNLVIVLGRETLHHDAHGPHHIIADVGATDALASLAAEEPRVVLAPYESARVLIDRK